ncbi:hypothetical protein BGI32_06675 [Snodgrassella alvi]|uniref:Uncharacterized protein n=2 Tax=Snodgrassella alvi TaxID=1196083 RepID=A0A2N9WTJ2_9NEIS|nr:hypothetical protein BGI32_06675 [Snodgrassella alvi]
MAIALSGMMFSTQAVAETQIITLPGDEIEYELQPFNDVDGIAGTNAGKNGTDGEAAYIFQTMDETLAAENPISVNSDVIIHGDNGGDGSASGDGDEGAVTISEDSLQINNNGEIYGI